MVQVDFNYNETESAQGRDKLPEGRYLARLDDTSFDQYDNIEFVFTVADGDKKGRKIWWKYKSDVEFHARLLKNMCIQQGITELRDTAQFHGKSFVIDVTYREYNGKKYQNQMFPAQPLRGPEAEPATADTAAPWLHAEGFGEAT